VSPSYKSGFTLLELLVAMVIIAIVATIVVPNLRQKPANADRQEFVRNLNGLCALAWHQATVTGKKQKIEFDFDKRTITVQSASDKKDSKGEPVFEPLKGAYLKTSFIWPKTIEVKNFIVEGFDEMSKFTMGRTTASWFFIIPGKFAQEVTINAIDKKDARGGKARPFGLVISPFTAQFKEYDTFQK